MELAIIKRETTGSGPNMYHESETVTKYEIMDGAPVKGESIPIRLFLAGFELSPTMRDVHKKFSVRYFLNLVLVDEEDRRYFKQQEITIWRKGPQKKTAAAIEADMTKKRRVTPRLRRRRSYLCHLLPGRPSCLSSLAGRTPTADVPGLETLGGCRESNDDPL